MCTKRLFGFLLLGSWVLSGCAVRRYQSAPIVPTESASRLASRSLTDPGLHFFVEENLGHPLTSWPPEVWDLNTLSLAALYFSPALDSVRARVMEAHAAVVTAGGRPNPTLSVAPGVPSPYLFNLEFAVPIETAGKRGHRIRSARSLEQAARLELGNAAWKLHIAVRIGVLNYLLASRSLELFRSEESVRTQQVRLLEQRFAVGEIPRPEVDLARIELSKTHLATSTADGEVAQAKTVLAATIGIPTAAIEGLNFSWADLDSPPSAESLSPAQIQREAVLNRLDVRRSLAQYAAAEAELQLEIAKQYPDVQIGPGYTFEEKNNFFTLGLATTLPLFNRNQGPIAEAEARRKGAGASFLEKQAQVIAESERALAFYVAALKELEEADRSLHRLQESRLQMAERAVQVGQEDRLSLIGVQIETSVVSRARLDALARAQSALGELEDAVQRPLDLGDGFSVSPESPALNRAPQESRP